MIWLAAFFLLLISLLFTHIRIGLFYKRESGNDRLKVEIGLFDGRIPIRKEIPFIRFHIKGIEAEHTLESGEKTVQIKKSAVTPDKVRHLHKKVGKWIRQIHDYNRIMKRFLRKINVIHFKWKSAIGTGDAAVTGLLSGIVWGMKETAVMALLHFTRLKARPQIWVEPSFVQRQFATELECILQFRLGYLMIMGVQLLMNRRKGRDRDDGTPH